MVELQIFLRNLDCQDTTWIAYPAEGDVPYYFDTINLAGQWDKPDDFQANTTHLTTEEIQVVLTIYLFLCKNLV